MRENIPKSTEDLSKFYEEEASLIGSLKLESSLERQEEDWEQSSGVLGLRTEESTTPLLLHEETLTCWCRPQLIEEGGIYIIVHRSKASPDA